MAYKTSYLEKQAIDAINKHKVICIEDVVYFMDCSRATFYNQKLDQLDTIKAALSKVKAELKGGLRKKMYESDSPADRAMLYKLCSTDEEIAKISMQNVKMEHSGGITINLQDGTGNG